VRPYRWNSDDSEDIRRPRFEAPSLEQESEKRRVWVRRCRCGKLDLSEQWDSPGAADRAGVWRRAWKCSECGGTVFELALIQDERRTKIPEAFLKVAWDD
jgi:hypothetical protein